MQTFLPNHIPVPIPPNHIPTTTHKFSNFQHVHFFIWRFTLSPGDCFALPRTIAQELMIEGRWWRNVQNLSAQEEIIPKMCACPSSQSLYRNIRFQLPMVVTCFILGPLFAPMSLFHFQINSSCLNPCVSWFASGGNPNYGITLISIFANRVKWLVIS